MDGYIGGLRITKPICQALQIEQIAEGVAEQCEQKQKSDLIEYRSDHPGQEYDNCDAPEFLYPT